MNSTYLIILIPLNSWLELLHATCRVLLKYPQKKKVTSNFSFMLGRKQETWTAPIRAGFRDQPPRKIPCWRNGGEGTAAVDCVMLQGRNGPALTPLLRAPVNLPSLFENAELAFPINSAEPPPLWQVHSGSKVPCTHAVAILCHCDPIFPSFLLFLLK